MRTFAFFGMPRMRADLHVPASVAAQLRPASVSGSGVPTTPRSNGSRRCSPGSDDAGGYEEYAFIADLYDHVTP
jgi:hypothetical protein